MSWPGDQKKHYSRNTQVKMTTNSTSLQVTNMLLAVLVTMAHNFRVVRREQTEK